MLLDDLPIFDRLTPALRLDLNARAERRTYAPGEVLFYPGDPADALMVLAAGACRLEDPGASGAALRLDAPTLLDAETSLGGLPHRVKAAAETACAVLCWPVERLWADGAFRDAARRWLAESLMAAQDRVRALDAPRVFNARAELPPGPFLFEDATILFAFCEGNLDSLRGLLPEGLRLFRRVGRRRDAVLLAFADFPRAYPESDPDAAFGYTETTVFVPVRFGVRLGLTVPYIYPSTYDPILLGREIYGFPKQLGHTSLSGRAASLSVGEPAQAALAWQAALTWDAMHPCDEARLVRALMDWLGLEGWTLSLAFQAGDVLRRAMQLPPFRRVSVYNHKRILDASADAGRPTWAVDQITHALFGVLRWYQIARLETPALTVSAGPLAEWGLRLREAYRAQLDMRLSRGKVVKDLLRRQPVPYGE